MTEISVVIPTYNRAPLLKEALDSVCQQVRKPLEILVIDDGSTDDTDLVCRQAKLPVRYFYQERKGVSAARNLGVQKAEGDWVAFLDSDDLWLPEKLEIQNRFIVGNPSAKILQTEEIWIRRGVLVQPKKIHQKKSGFIFEACIPLCIVSPSAVMIHKEVFEKVGLFDEAFPICEDYDLWLRIALHYPIYTLPEKLTTKRNGHEGQLSARREQDRFRIQALLKILKDSAIKPEQAALVRADIRRRAKILSQGYAKRGRTEEAQAFIALADTSRSVAFQQEYDFSSLRPVAPSSPSPEVPTLHPARKA